MTLYTKKSIIESIQKFYANKDVKPRTRDFVGNPDYPSRDTIVRYFGSFNAAIIEAGLFHRKTPNTNYAHQTKAGIILAIQKYYSSHNKVPTTRDFENNKDYPVPSTVKNLFGSWNTAIAAAGFNPISQNGHGTCTQGLDGHLYRSRAEAYFADTYLHDKYEYVIEPKYPEPYNKWYDWYVPSLDIYIELDGGIRPLVTINKKEINKTLNRVCLFITTEEIFNKSSIIDFL